MAAVDYVGSILLRQAFPLLCSRCAGRRQICEEQHWPSSTSPWGGGEKCVPGCGMGTCATTDRSSCDGTPPPPPHGGPTNKRAERAAPGDCEARGARGDEPRQSKASASSVCDDCSDRQRSVSVLPDGWTKYSQGKRLAWRRDLVHEAESSSR